MPAFNPLAYFEDEFDTGGQRNPSEKVDVGRLLADPTQDTELTVKAKPKAVQANPGQSSGGGQPANPRPKQDGGGNFISQALGAIGDVANFIGGGAGDIFEFLTQPGVANVIGQLGTALSGNDPIGRALGQVGSNIASTQQLKAVEEAQRQGTFDELGKVDLFGLTPEQIEAARNVVRGEQKAAREERESQARIGLQGAQQGFYEARPEIASQDRATQERIAQMQDETRRIITQADNNTRMRIAELRNRGYQPLVVDMGDQKALVAFNRESGGMEMLGTLPVTDPRGVGGGGQGRAPKVTPADVNLASQKMQTSNVFKALMEQRGQSGFARFFRRFIGQNPSEVDEETRATLANELLTRGMTPEQFKQVTGREPNAAEMAELEEMAQGVQLQRQFYDQFTGQRQAVGVPNAQADEFGFIPGQERVDKNGNTRVYVGNNKWRLK